MTSRPALIPHKKKHFFHRVKSCIDIRNGKVHAIKANTNNRTWHNEVNEKTAIISINPRTRRENKLVYDSKEPFHVLSFGCGADTYYWGRYKCVGGKGVFNLQYVDDGDLSKCESDGLNGKRSNLEGAWAETFQKHGVDVTFEPATMKLSDKTEYTPDFWIRANNEFIEIKGPPPTQREFDKCFETRKLGFNIRMFRGSPTNFDEYVWTESGKRTKKHHSSYYRYLHPKPKRNKRKIFNISI